MKTEYEQKAIDFLQSTNTEFKAEFLRNDKYFPDDKETRDIYKITLTRNGRFYSFEFGQSTMNSTKYVDTLTKNEFTTSGSPLKGKMRVIDTRFFNDLHVKKVNGIAPNCYDVLACLTKYDPGTFENFCGEFGYDTDSRKAKKTYKAVRKEYQNLRALFTDSEMELMAEIN